MIQTKSISLLEPCIAENISVARTEVRIYSLKWHEYCVLNSCPHLSSPRWSHIDTTNDKSLHFLEDRHWNQESGSPSWHYDTFYVSFMSKFLIKAAFYYTSTRALLERQFVSVLMYLTSKVLKNGPNIYHWGVWSTVNGVTIKVKWEVHSGPLRGLSTANARLWVWWWILSQRWKFVCRTTRSRVRTGLRSRSRGFRFNKNNSIIVEGLGTKTQRQRVL